ncbi:uncharacterized protein LOC142101636 [Mixophyes fleayi]|uniref:uncharacterized protein LOC142101636 n=1 Tax=Mixophyes fleayi TaxID=3061075 RepID=UPI003F4DD9E3
MIYSSLTSLLSLYLPASHIQPFHILPPPHSPLSLPIPLPISLLSSLLCLWAPDLTCCPLFYILLSPPFPHSHHFPLVPFAALLSASVCSYLPPPSLSPQLIFSLRSLLPSASPTHKPPYLPHLHSSPTSCSPAPRLLSADKSPLISASRPIQTLSSCHSPRSLSYSPLQTSNPNNLIHISSLPSLPLSCGLWNARSVCNKLTSIHDLFISRSFNLLAIPETWLSPEDTTSPAALSFGGCPSPTHPDLGSGKVVALAYFSPPAVLFGFFPLNPPSLFPPTLYPPIPPSPPSYCCYLPSCWSCLPIS